MYATNPPTIISPGIFIVRPSISISIFIYDLVPVIFISILYQKLFFSFRNGFGVIYFGFYI
ncbi:hypothetical protein SPRA44_410002 [Serratia proteamaculans]|nr:hypothetical protein SPRA44_410002 [Serratia proteamaculans]